MKCETGVLQQWVQAVAVQRRRIDPCEGVGCKQNEEQEPNANHRLNRRRGHAVPGQTAPEYRYRQAIQALSMKVQSSMEPS